MAGRANPWFARASVRSTTTPRRDRATRTNVSTAPRAEPRPAAAAARADHRFTVAASGVRGVLAYARARGVEVQGVLEAVGLSAAALEGPEARVSQAAHNQVFAELAARADDDAFGLHFAEHLELDALGVVGHLAAASATLGQALARVCAHSRILHDSGRVDLEVRGDRAVIYPGCRGLRHEFPRQVAEFSVAATLTMARRLTTAAINPGAVTFQHAAPTRTAEHRRVLGVPPTFGALETALELPARALALPVVGAQPGLAGYLDAYARQVVASLPSDDSLRGKVLRAVTTALPRGVPALGEIAAQLGLSTRTLQRQLASEGARWRRAGRRRAAPARRAPPATLRAAVGGDRLSRRLRRRQQLPPRVPALDRSDPERLSRRARQICYRRAMNLRIGLLLVATVLGCGGSRTTSPAAADHPATGLAPGDYACSFSGYPEFLCRITADGPGLTLEKLGGSERFRGQLTADGADVRFANGGAGDPAELTFQRQADGSWFARLPGDGEIIGYRLRALGALGSQYGGQGYAGAISEPASAP